MPNFRVSIGSYADYDPELFAQLQTPETVDRQTLIDTILAEYGDMEMAYSIEQMPNKIGLWSRTHQYMMEGIMATTLQKYNLLENTDRHELITDTTKGLSKVSTKGKTTTNAKDSHSVVGYEQATPSLNDETSTTGGGSTEAGTEGNSESTYTHEAHIHGNIGVTTNQEMLIQERACVMYDAYAAIAKDFCLRLLIAIWY